MSSGVTTIRPLDNSRADLGANLLSQGVVDQQIHETERTLERLKRDLTLAQTRARQQEQKIAEARRRMEQWRWANAINEIDPEAHRLVAISLAAQSQIVDVAVKSNADVSARIERLQNRIERQIARYFDLQSRRRVGPGARSRDRDALPPPEKSEDGLASLGVDIQPSGEDAAGGVSLYERRTAMTYFGYVFGRDGV